MKDGLQDFFSCLKEEKTKKKEEIKELVGDSFDKLFLDQIKPVKTTKEISKKFDIPPENIKKQLKKGSKVEHEHTVDDDLATAIASHHIDELPDYYDRLAKIEKKKDVKEDSIIEKALGLLAEPTTTNNVDPLTPIDQKISDLNKNYNLLISRIQQQLSTLGGGGEVNLAYMDIPTVTVESSSYAVKSQDYYIGVNYNGLTTITLPPQTNNGKTYVVKDESGDASNEGRFITITGSNNQLIDGESSVIIGFDYGAITFIYQNGWRVI